MNADSDEELLLDLDQFTKDFDEGRFNHLVLAKKRKTVKKLVNNSIRLKDTLPSEIIPCKEIITCSGCGGSRTYLIQYLLKTFYAKSNALKPVSGSNKKHFLQLLETNSFGEAIVTKICYLRCPECKPLLKDQ